MPPKVRISVFFDLCVIFAEIYYWKRKRADAPPPDAEASSTRATRSSARVTNVSASAIAPSKSALSKQPPTKAQEVEVRCPVWLLTIVRILTVASSKGHASSEEG